MKISNFDVPVYVILLIIIVAAVLLRKLLLRIERRKQLSQINPTTKVLKPSLLPWVILMIASPFFSIGLYKFLHKKKVEHE